MTLKKVASILFWIFVWAASGFVLYKNITTKVYNFRSLHYTFEQEPFHFLFFVGITAFFFLGASLVLYTTFFGSKK
ncbi:hypothetical protein [Hugenholtzia roseola]|uniref:hypothetical protein n=1 Tax=Hugenholtzia roseola TaxID=1002 RepID=UPI0004129714|nr:hypothetical protein [Hugenholtzia roseola]